MLSGLSYADIWLKKGEKYLEKQELWMRVFSLGPFLFGVDNIISNAWDKALQNAKLLLTKRRYFFIRILIILDIYIISVN